MVSIHAPHAGERLSTRSVSAAPVCFNPRPPRRGATSHHLVLRNRASFNPRPPRRGATSCSLACAWASRFQSTPPTQGSDRRGCCEFRPTHRFNPRPPRRGATFWPANVYPFLGVSIHAPHAGERPLLQRFLDLLITFQSTPPTQGSDGAGFEYLVAGQFQSTPPTQGSDLTCACKRRYLTRFQSTPPTQGSDMLSPTIADSLSVSIHAPHAGERHAR